MADRKQTHTADSAGLGAEPMDGEARAPDPVLARQPVPGSVLHAEPGLRVTMLAAPHPGIMTYRSRRFGITHQIASKSAHHLAMAVDLRADVRKVRFNGLLIEAYDGHRIREHVPTAVIATPHGNMIVDVHGSFGEGFLACCINEQAARALGWAADTIEEDQIGSPAFMAMAREVADARDHPMSKAERAHVVDTVASASSGGKGRLDMSELANLVGPDAPRGREKILALVSRGELTLRARGPRPLLRPQPRSVTVTV